MDQGTEGRSAVGLTPQHVNRLQAVKDHMRLKSGRSHSHVEAIEHLLALWEARHKGDQ